MSEAFAEGSVTGGPRTEAEWDRWLLNGTTRDPLLEAGKALAKAAKRMDIAATDFLAAWAKQNETLGRIEP